MARRKPAQATMTDLDLAVITHTGTEDHATSSDDAVNEIGTGTEDHALGQLDNATDGRHIGGAEIAGQQLARDRTLTGPIVP